MLCAEHLSVRYGGKEAVRDLSFRVGKGEITVDEAVTMYGSFEEPK